MKSVSVSPPVHPHTCLPHLDLVCTAHSFASMRAAIDNGADCVYLALRPGQAAHPTVRADLSALKKGVAYSHARRRKAVLDLRSPIHPATWPGIRDLIVDAAYSSIDALAFSDTAVMLYCMSTFPHLPLHYAVPQERLNLAQIGDLHTRFGISNVILPPVSSLALIRQLRTLPRLDVAVQVYGTASALIAPREVARGPRKDNSSFHTGQKHGGNLPGSGIETCTRSMHSEQCAIDERASNDCNYSAKPHDASTLTLIPQLSEMGVRAIHITTNHHDAANVGRVTRVWHDAIDACYSSAGHYIIKPAWVELLNRCSGSNR